MENKYDENVLRSRSDIRALLDMPKEEFVEWYNARSAATERVLQDCRLVTDIPSLLNQSHDGSTMRESTISGMMDGLERGLEYLKVIRKLRD